MARKLGWLSDDHKPATGIAEVRIWRPSDWMPLKRILPIVACTALFVSASHASAQYWGEPSHLVAIASARELADGIYGDFYATDVALSDAIVAMTFGVPQPGLTDVGGGLRMLSGCRVHSCDEKGAVIIDASDQVLVAGILHFGCSEERRVSGGRTCLRHPTLTLLQRTPASLAARDQILRWARERAPGYRGVTVIAP